MVNINGHVPNINLGLSATVIGLMIFTIIVGGYYIQETRNIAEKTAELAALQHKKLSNFIENWETRVQIGNKIGNLTQHRLIGLTENMSTTLNLTHEQETQLLNLAHNQTLILDKQIGNEKNIIGNLSGHRIIANLTYKEIIDNQKTINHLLNNTLTGAEYAKLANSRVDNIVGNLSAEHQKIMQALNITNTTQTETNKNATINDKTVQQILDILNKTQ